MKETEKPSEICLAPWNLLRIEANGNCYSCSSAYVKDDYYLGNIFTDDINEIWNGEKARQFRADKLSGEYKFCQTEKCHFFAKNRNHYDPYNPQNLLTEEKINELGIINNIEEICISIHCATEKTYKKIFRNNNFAKVMKNIEYIVNLKKENKIKTICLEFVITKDNYKEIKQFLKIAEKYGIGWTFNYVVPSDTKYTKNPYNYEIYNTKHYLYNDYVAC